VAAPFYFPMSCVWGSDFFSPHHCFDSSHKVVFPSDTDSNFPDTWRGEYLSSMLFLDICVSSLLSNFYNPVVICMVRIIKVIFFLNWSCIFLWFKQRGFFLEGGGFFYQFCVSWL
jgi:hypothetical protein